MASVIDRAVNALPAEGLRFEATSRRLTVPPATDDGFSVRLVVHGDREYEVQGEGWSERFGRAEDAYDCFLFLLSEESRLKVMLRGTTAVGWQVEKREYGLWVPAHPVRRRLVPIWRLPRTVWKQNHVFKMEPS
jgi:hypothetical protein